MEYFHIKATVMLQKYHEYPQAEQEHFECRNEFVIDIKKDEYRTIHSICLKPHKGASKYWFSPGFVRCESLYEECVSKVNMRA